MIKLPFTDCCHCTNLDPMGFCLIKKKYLKEKIKECDDIKYDDWIYELIEKFLQKSRRPKNLTYFIS